MIVFLGCFFGLAASSICLALDILLEQISCFGIGIIAALTALPVILILFSLFLRTPVYSSHVCSLQEKDDETLEEDKSEISGSTAKGQVLVE